MSMQQQIADLQRQVAALSARVDQRPIIQHVPRVQSFYVVVDMGNVLTSANDGIKKVSSVIASVPSLYDPNVTTSFIDGIGRGQLFVNSVAQPGYVLIVNDTRSAYPNALIKDDLFASLGPVSIPVAGGGAVTAYAVA